MNYTKFLILISVIVSNIVFAQDYSSNRFNDRLDRLERDLAIMQKQFYNGQEGQLGKAYDNPQLSKENAGDFETRISSLEEQIRYLSGSVEEAKHSEEKFQAMIDNLKKDIDFRLEEINSKMEIALEKNIDKTTTNSSTASELKNPNHDTKQADKNSAKKEYDHIFTLIKSGNNSEAEKLLKAFVKKHENNDLTGTAYFWLGEIYYSQKKYNEAAINYLYCYKKFPSGSKAVHALQKLSSSLSKLGKVKEACNAIEKISQYKNISDSIKKSIEKEKINLKCQ